MTWGAPLSYTVNMQCLRQCDNMTVNIVRIKDLTKKPYIMFSISFRASQLLVLHIEHTPVYSSLDRLVFSTVVN